MTASLEQGRKIWEFISDHRHCLVCLKPVAADEFERGAGQCAGCRSKRTQAPVS
jgi:predicted nucleic acid-binding Zn ribbon protein